MLSESELRFVIEGGENTTVEFKVSTPRPGELAERLCGMANSQGGLIIIGVEDISLAIVGVQNARLAVDVLLRAARQIQPALVLDPPEPQVRIIDDKLLVIACVPPSFGPLYQSSGVCWMRRSTYTVPLNVSELLEIANDRGLVRWELQPTRNTTLDDIDVELVNNHLEYRSAQNLQSRRFNDVEKVLLGMNCAVITSSGELLLTNAGILFFGKDPQRFLPQSEVVCMLYQDELGVRGYIERKVVTGTLQKLIDEAETFVAKCITFEENSENLERSGSSRYSTVALREAIVNAIVHRDYSRIGESIRIFCYSDRVEIHSPGMLLPGISTKHMVKGEVISKLRNPILVNLLRDIPGYLERIGSGIRLMHYEMEVLELPPPQFREMNEFIVIFRGVHSPTIMSTDSLLDKNGMRSTGLMKGEVGKNGVANSLLNQQQRMILAMHYVQEQGSITNKKYRELTGASENTALRDLEILVEQGSLKSVGKKRGRQYQIL